MNVGFPVAESGNASLNGTEEEFQEAIAGDGRTECRDQRGDQIGERTHNETPRVG
ncbi:hypothetical protein GCM10011588_48850 [Nocardia jinanensis]|uniref:Uncharacterized protein n=1 Tax=Nocardia jinanensis TaxID=382504 RepID=A0A917RU48_9NOCA|nr:hypothetical protein GCM10011588_48850 [Nocardia jinanensis]